MKALNFLIHMRDNSHCSPQSKEGTKVGKPSNGELRRWLICKAVKINNRFPAWNEEIEFPIFELIYFPKNQKSKTTIISY